MPPPRARWLRITKVRAKKAHKPFKYLVDAVAQARQLGLGESFKRGSPLHKKAKELHAAWKAARAGSLRVEEVD